MRPAPQADTQVTLTLSNPEQDLLPSTASAPTHSTMMPRNQTESSITNISVAALPEQADASASGEHSAAANATAYAAEPTLRTPFPPLDAPGTPGSPTPATAEQTVHCTIHPHHGAGMADTAISTGTQAVPPAEPDGEAALLAAQMPDVLQERSRSAAAGAFQVDDAFQERLNATLAQYVGTHNFHNFTTRVAASDPSAKRYIRSFRCEGTMQLQVSAPVQPSHASTFFTSLQY